MEDIIRKIIEMEHQAQQIVDSAKDEETRIMKNAQDEAQTIHAHIREMAEHKVDQLKGKTQYDADDRIIRIYEDTAMKMRLMEENAEENQERWENEVFNRIVGR